MYCYICTCFIYLFFIDVLIHFPPFSCSSNEDLFFSNYIPTMCHPAKFSQEKDILSFCFKFNACTFRKPN